MLTVEVHHRIVGDSTPDFTALELLHETLTVAALIQHTVEEQVRDLLIHRQMDIEQACHRLNRQYLTSEEIQHQAQAGAVIVHNKLPNSPRLDPAHEIAKAQRAFQNRAFVVIVDGQQPAHLSDVITLTPTSKVTFLRLMPLVGG